MNTTSTAALRRFSAAAVLTGAAVLAGAPAYAGPEAPVVSQPSAQQSARVAEHAAGTDGAANSADGQVGRMQRELTERQPAQQPASNTPSDTSDPSSVPLTLLSLLGGGVVAGAAGYSVYRFRHHGPVGATTA